MKIAITTDWLVTEGGAERVIRELCLLFPEATVFTTVHKKGVMEGCGNEIRTSYVQPLYRLIGDHRVLLPCMPRAVESWDLRGYDLVISSSHAVAKGCIIPPTALHICYCHTPIRYAWDMEQQYLNDFRVKGRLRKAIQNRLKILRRWDLSTAKRVDAFIANSTVVQERISRIYDRKSTVITPPIHDRFFLTSLTRKRDDYYLAVGRLVPYKRFDILIQAANAAGFPLSIAGAGSEERRLRSMAGPTVTFLGRIPEAELPELYAQAKAVLFPVEEDAGIVPLEAQASGTPVIAYDKGGSLDTVVDGETGTLFTEQTVDSLIDALQRHDAQQWDPEIIRNHARLCSASEFRKKIDGFVRHALSEHSSRSSLQLLSENR